VVLGKYTAAYALYLSLWGATGGFFYILKRFSSDPRLIDSGPLIGGYVFIAVSGLLFVAIGVFASSLSRNQAVAGILCFVMLAGLIVGGAGSVKRVSSTAICSLPPKPPWITPRFFSHYEDFTRGVIDARHVLFYFSGTALALIFSILSVEAKQIHA
jgi:ABC-2 type transport system permease protein